MLLFCFLPRHFKGLGMMWFWLTGRLMDSGSMRFYWVQHKIWIIKATLWTFLQVLDSEFWFWLTTATKWCTSDMQHCRCNTDTSVPNSLQYMTWCWRWPWQHKKATRTNWTRRLEKEGHFCFSLVAAYLSQVAEVSSRWWQLTSTTFSYYLRKICSAF